MEPFKLTVDKHMCTKGKDTFLIQSLEDVKNFDNILQYMVCSEDDHDILNLGYIKLGINSSYRPVYSDNTANMFFHKVFSNNETTPHRHLLKKVLCLSRTKRSQLDSASDSLVSYTSFSSCNIPEGLVFKEYEGQLWLVEDEDVEALNTNPAKFRFPCINDVMSGSFNKFAENLGTRILLSGDQCPCGIEKCNGNGSSSLSPSSSSSSSSDVSEEKFNYLHYGHPSLQFLPSLMKASSDEEFLECVNSFHRKLATVNEFQFYYLKNMSFTQLQSELNSCDRGAIIDIDKIETPLSQILKRNFEGITTSNVYFGSPLSVFPLHSEDYYEANSLNIHLYGAPKFWIICDNVSADDVYKKLSDFFTKHCYLKFPPTADSSLEDDSPCSTGKGDYCWSLSDFDLEQPCVMRKKLFYFSPQLLTALGISFHVVLQRPGDCILTRAGNFHQIINLGYNASAAINLALLDYEWKMLDYIRSPFSSEYDCFHNDGTTNEETNGLITSEKLLNFSIEYYAAKGVSLTKPRGNAKSLLRKKVPKFKAFCIETTATLKQLKAARASLTETIYEIRRWFKDTYPRGLEKPHSPPILRTLKEVVVVTRIFTITDYVTTNHLGQKSSTDASTDEVESWFNSTDCDNSGTEAMIDCETKDDAIFGNDDEEVFEQELKGGSENVKDLMESPQNFAQVSTAFTEKFYTTNRSAVASTSAQTHIVTPPPGPDHWYCRGAAVDVAQAAASEVTQVAASEMTQVAPSEVTQVPDNEVTQVPDNDVRPVSPSETLQVEAECCEIANVTACTETPPVSNDENEVVDVDSFKVPVITAVKSVNSTSQRKLYQRRRRFACQTCDRVFNRSEVLKQHIEIHLSDDQRTRYQCLLQNCPRSFKTRTGLHRHKRNCHFDLVGCYACKTVFQTPEQLASHFGNPQSCMPLVREARLDSMRRNWKNGTSQQAKPN